MVKIINKITGKSYIHSTTTKIVQSMTKIYVIAEIYFADEFGDYEGIKQTKVTEYDSDKFFVEGEET